MVAIGKLLYKIDSDAAHVPVINLTYIVPSTVVATEGEALGLALGDNEGLMEGELEGLLDGDNEGDLLDDALAEGESEGD